MKLFLLFAGMMLLACGKNNNARLHNWFTTVSMPRSNHFIMRQKMQSRIMEFHYTAE